MVAVVTLDGSKPGTEAAQMHERAHQQAGADEQHDAHRHLADDEQAPRPPAVAAGDGARARFRQRRLDVDPARVKRGHEAEHHARDDRHQQRDDEDADVELHGIAQREHVAR